MAFKTFSKNYTSPADQAWRDGSPVDNSTLGPYQNLSADSFKNGFVAKMREDHPDFPGFFQQAFGSKTAQQSQEKINTASKTKDATFADDRNNTLANDFLTKYSEGVARGLVEEDKAVFPENLSRLVTEHATAGSNLKDPNTTNRFPGESGVQAS